MKKLVAYLSVMLLACGFASVVLASSDNNGIIVKSNAAKIFAVLPSGTSFPEGITVNPYNGDIIVGTFNFPGFPVANQLLRFNKSGKLVAKLEVGTAPLLGLAYNPGDNMVYFASIGDFNSTGSRIQRVEADFTDLSSAVDVVGIPGIGAPPNRSVANPDGSTDTITFGQAARVPNGLAFTDNGDLYVSDSFQGAIFLFETPAINCPGMACIVETIVHDGLLATTGFPPFGANGLALNKDETVLFIANTGDDRVLKLVLESGVISIFAESINGADGLAMDSDGTLWVAANQADNVVALNGAGRIIARLGAFLGIRKDGAARGLAFPASLVIVKGKIFVTNLAIPLRGQGPGGAEPEADITKYTISRINIPRLRH